MAMPSLSHEDLQKLKEFIDFVTANPTILNFPQLDFVKKFIEKFGGKVPPGEFEMNVEGKCPFGGGGGGASGVKTEGKSAEPEENSEPEEAEMESDPESEIELDMEVESLPKRGESQETEQKTENEILIQETKKNGVTQKKEKAKDEDEKSNFIVSKLAENHTLEPENITSADGTKIGVDQKSNYMDIKDETDLKQPSNKKSKMSSKRQAEIYTVHENDRACLSENKRKRKRKPKRVNCSKFCQQNCIENINEEMRQQLCSEYWALNDEERKKYILTWVERQSCAILKVNKSKRVNRSLTILYFFKNNAGERTRVCRNFFRSTLSIKRHFINNTIENDETNCIKQGIVLNKKSQSTLKYVEELNTVEESKDIGSKKYDSLAKISHKLPILPCSKVKIKRNKPKIPQLKKVHLPLPVSCNKSCKFECTNHFTEKQRVQICGKFWKMDFKQRKDFVLSRIDPPNTERTMAQGYRNRYYFQSHKDEDVRICAKFFMATLRIGCSFIQNLLRNTNKQTRSYAVESKPVRNNLQTHDGLIIGVKRHIESYPTWVTHRGHKTHFLHSSLSIEKMFFEYKKSCVEKKRKFVSRSFYKHIFRQHFRLAFLKPNLKFNKQELITAKSRVTSEKSNRGSLKKIDTNISNYTGIAGIFICPNIAVMTDSKKNDRQTQTCFQYPQQKSASLSALNRVYCDKNLQLHASKSLDFKMAQYDIEFYNVKQTLDLHYYNQNSLK